MNIENFIPTYPNIGDKKFIEEISRRKEFQDLSLMPEEKVPVKGEYLLSQEFMRRFLSQYTPYREMLAFHALGTGKTCLSSAIVENFKQTTVGGRPRKRALIIVKSRILADNYKREIVEVCTNEIYKPIATEKEKEMGLDMGPRAYQIRLGRSIAQSYEIVSFETFLPYVSKLPNDVIKKEYSNRLIIIDEAHNLRIQPDDKESAGLYHSAHKFLHTVENCLILLLSGTPIWDRTREIASLMNLILPLDQQFETENEFDSKYFDEKGTVPEEMRDVFKEKIRGRVSYLRSMMTSALRKEIGQKEPWMKYITIKPDGMSKFQQMHSKKARDLIQIQIVKHKGKEIERKIEGGALAVDARDASNFVFPDGSYGKTGFKKYCTRMQKKMKGDSEVSVETYRLSEELKAKVKENLHTYSAKFASILKEIKDHPNELVYIFGEQVYGSGLILLSLIIQELLGYTLITGKVSSKTHNKAKRCAVITSNVNTIHDTNKIKEVIDGWNEPENKYGDYLRIIIGSERIAQGISLKNVRQVHVVSAHWNLPYQYQAVARALRFGGHNALSPNERIVKIFYHCAVESKSGKLDADLDEKAETIDLRIYRVAEDKEKRNTQIYRLLKEASVDCAIFYRRNVLETDVPGSRDCDYGPCNYVCDSFPPKQDGKVWSYEVPEKKIIVDNYNLFYSKKEIGQLIHQIRELFGSYFALNFQMIVKLLKPRDVSLLLSALSTIISNRIVIRNRYGFPTFLRENNNIYFLDNKVSHSANHLDLTYIASPYVNETKKLSEIIEVNVIGQDKKNVLDFCKNPTLEIFEKMNHKTRILLLELAYEKIETKEKMSSKQKNVVNEILRFWGTNVVRLADGTLVHSLYDSEYTGQSYNVSAFAVKVSGSMRFFNKATSKWENVPDLETEQAYVEQMKEKVQKKKEIGFENNPYDMYGTISSKDGKFRIVRKAKPGEAQKRGLVCTSEKLPRLIETFFELKYLPPPNPEFKSLSKDSLIEKIKGLPKIPDEYKEDLKSKSQGTLAAYLTLFTMKIPALCEQLKQWFSDNDLMFTI